MSRKQMYQLIKKIIETKDNKYIKQCIFDKKLKIDEYGRAQLILATGDINFEKDCLTNKELNLTPYGRTALISGINDREFLDECIHNEKLNLNRFEIVQLILETKDTKYIKKCVFDQTIKLKVYERLQLMQKTGDPEYLRNDFTPKGVEKMPSIDLPKEMTIGIEIESEGELNYSYFFANDWLLGWRPKNEPTLPEGTEIVSPKLNGKGVDSYDIYAVCNMLIKIGQKTSEKCGGHIHIGASYLTTKKSYANLILLYANAERILYLISNVPGELPRKESIGHYAIPLSKKIQQYTDSKNADLANEENFKDFINKLKSIQKTRYYGLNFQSVNESYKDTIEFRLPNGTLNPQTWIENINLFGGLVKTAEELATIQVKPLEERSQDEQKKMNLFKIICSSDTSEKDVLNALLSLIVDEDKIHIYEKRYIMNNELLEANIELKKMFDEHIWETTTISTQIEKNSNQLARRYRQEKWYATFLNYIRSFFKKN